MGKRSKITVKFKIAVSGHALLQEASADMGLSVTEIILRGLEKELSPWVKKQMSERLNEITKCDRSGPKGPDMDREPSGR